MAARVECLDETTVTLFLARRLPEAHATSVEGHIDHCDSCRRLLSELARARPPGDHVDRYVLLRAIGTGGMGSVYAAYDTVLDRKVALKLLRPDRVGDGDSRARLVREAQAMAKVTSPHVVSVFDVGTFHDEIFLSMELVGGGTLKAWLRERARTWRDVVRVMIAAGRGLAAAHANGLVHRDFKPDNVLLDGDRVCVADFGLAVPVGDRVAARAATTALDEPLTITGAIVGTPAYMAPEQLAGEPVDARSDQFSFCVTLYEALYGERPFGGTTVDEYLRELQAGRVRDPDGSAPARVRAAVLRGLSIDPAARFPSLAALVDRLDSTQRSRRLLAVGAAAALVAVGGGAYALASSSSRPPAPCSDADQQLAAVWNPERRLRLAAAIAATGVPFAADSWRRIESAIDTYASAWIAMHTETCEATAVQHRQSSELLDRRMSCLARQRAELDATIETLTATDREGMRHAVEVATGLPSLTVCSDPGLVTTPPPPSDPDRVAELASVDREVARAEALFRGGDYARALTVALPAAERADRLDYAPTVAAAHLVAGRAQRMTGGDREARASIERTIVAATKSNSEEIEARALGELAQLTRDASPDSKVATEHAQHALAIAERMHRDPLLEVEMRYVYIDTLAGIDVDEMQRQLQRGLAQLARAGGSPRALAIRMHYERTIALLADNADAALAKLATALATAEAAYGPDHPQIAVILIELARYSLNAERPEDARRYARRIAQIMSPYRGNEVELRRVDAELEQDPAKRLPILEQLVRDSEAMFGSHSARLAQDREELAEALLGLRRYREALTQIDAAIAILDVSYGSNYELVILSLTTRGQICGALEDWDCVTKSAERATAIADRHNVRDLTRAMAKLLLVESYFHQKKFEATIAVIDEVGPMIALVMLGDPRGLILQFYRAACMWELGRDRAASLRTAREIYAKLRVLPSMIEEKDSLEVLGAWLAGK